MLGEFPADAGGVQIQHPAGGELTARVPGDHVVPILAQRGVAFEQVPRFGAPGRGGVGVIGEAQAGAVEDGGRGLAGLQPRRRVEVGADLCTVETRSP